MKKVVIILFIVFWIGLISAQEINFSYPENVMVGREFNVKIILINFSDDSYDVKFEILNGTVNIAKRFWNNEWKSIFYWITDAINLSEKNNETFRLNITENYEGLNNISIKIRGSSNKEFKFFYLLNITSYNSSSNSPQNNSNNSQNKRIFYNLSWNEEDILNNEEFKIKVGVFNLEDKKYDIKLWIETDKVISERYNKENNEWKSGIYYINSFFKGPGNKSEEIKIRIDEDNRNFTGEADLLFKIRDEFEISYKINISGKNNKTRANVENNITKNNSIINKEKTDNKVSVTSNVIRLGEIANNKTEKEKTKNINNKYIVYESKSEIIKKYSVYGFAVLCVILSILIIWGKM